MTAPSFALLTHREWRAHPWRHAIIVLALAMGVALAWSVHLINASALAEFSAAVRSTQGEPDAVLRSARGVGGGVPDELLDRLRGDPVVAQAIGVVEVDTYARATAAPADAASAAATTSTGSARTAVRVLGVDALTAGVLAPSLVPRLGERDDPMQLLDPQRAFLNAAARQALGVRQGDRIALQAGPQWHEFIVSGDVAAAGSPLAVIDIAAAQDRFDHVGRLSRIDLRLAAGASVSALSVPLPPGARWQRADDGEQRVSNLSRAYRVNLTVLALVALLVGAFMAYSVVALAVAQRTPSLALLGVLGMTAAERRGLVLRECAWLGAAGSAVGLALGTAMAAWALRRLGGDLGGGYFPGVQPALRFDAPAAIAMGALGLAAALVGGWVPARDAQSIRPALALKGLGDPRASDGQWRAAGAALLVLGVVLALLPPVAGVPVAAYASVAALLFAGVALVPSVVEGLLRVAPVPASALGLLALRRAAFHRRTAMAVVAGVVSSLALSVALTVMVQSFRASVAQWLDQVLPADLYLRTGASAALAEQAWLDATFEAKAAALPGVKRVEVARLRAIAISNERPAVTLIARRLATLADPNERLPLVAPAMKARSGEIGAYASEAVERLYGARPGDILELPLPTTDGQPTVKLRVLGVWRDFARQFGAIAIDLDDYRRLTGD